MAKLIRNTENGKHFAFEDKGVVFWSKLPRENNFVQPAVYSGRVPPDNEVKRLKDKGYNVEVVDLPAA